MRSILFVVTVTCAFAVFAEDSAVPKGVTIAEAYEILGASHIVPASDAAHRWGLPQPDAATSLPIRYRRETLERCAEENESAGADWRLVYVFGLSLNDAVQQITSVRPHIDNLRPVELRADRGPRFEDAVQFDAPWMSTHPEVGYYLVDLAPRFMGTDWYDQHHKLTALRSVARVPEAAFVEIAVSIYGSMFLRITEDVLLFHRGPTKQGPDETLRVRVLAHQTKVVIALKFTDVECRCAGGTYAYWDFDF